MHTKELAHTPHCHTHTPTHTYCIHTWCAQTHTHTHTHTHTYLKGCPRQQLLLFTSISVERIEQLMSCPAWCRRVLGTGKSQVQAVCWAWRTGWRLTDWILQHNKHIITYPFLFVMEQAFFLFLFFFYFLFFYVYIRLSKLWMPISLQDRHCMA